MHMTADKDIPEWGRVLICGGTEWATNGGKNRRAAEGTDITAPHVLRSICNIKVTKILSSCSANYAIALDIYGTAHLFGKVPAYGPPSGVIPHEEPLRISPAGLGQPNATFVDGAVGYKHLFLLDSEGRVWGAGKNVCGQLGTPVLDDVDELVEVFGPWKSSGAKIVQVSAGQMFSLFLTDTGEVYAAGSSEHGQLGNGTTGRRIVKGGKETFDMQAPPRPVLGLQGKKIAQVSCGNQHSLAMDEDGNVYVWGNAGYCRLGLGDQQAKLTPTLVPQFSDKNAKKRAAMVVAGPTSSVVIDRMGMYHIAGKWKQTGPGSTGSPYTHFRAIDGLAGCKIELAALGGIGHFVTTPLDEGVQTIAWGQGALYGELGFGGGDKAFKSSAVPQVIEPLEGVDMMQIAAGMYFTLFLVRPSAATSELDRLPVEIESPDECIKCDNDGEALECEKCEAPYHLACTDPPLDAIPEGEWLCPDCEADAEATQWPAPSWAREGSDEERRGVKKRGRGGRSLSSGAGAGKRAKR